MQSQLLKILPAVALLFGISATPCQANVWMPAIFGDHMVIQQTIKLPVWGKADPGEEVTVTIGDRSGKTTAAPDGKWSLKLAPLKVGAKPLTMTVQGRNTLKFEDVLVGDVWVASGQSNMEFGLGNSSKGIEEIPKADHPLIRLFIVQRTPAFTPQDDVGAPGKPTDFVVGHWRVCTPDSVSKEGGWGGFSAIAYYFGREIQQYTGDPVGLIECPYGGMPVQAFTSIEALKQNPDFASYVAAYKSDMDAVPALKKAYPEAKAAYDKLSEKWEQDYGVKYKGVVEAWKQQLQQAKEAGLPFPPRPRPEVPAPTPPDDGSPKPRTASNLFNGMIHPVIPFGVKGVIWYQGESNTGAPWDYDKLFATLIGDWRTQWNEGDFPFLYVQLANFTSPQKTPVEISGYAVVRDMQLRTLRVKNTAMTVAIDVGEAADIHPRDKVDVGHRLALAARHLAYGEEIAWSGPLYDSMKVEGDKIRINFKHAGSDLKIAAHPKIYANETPSVPSELPAFAIAGSDQQWYSAHTSIDGSTLVVSSDQVKNPVAVRYGWANNPACHLYNSQGLPASPFRTDDWTDPAPPEKH